MTKSIPVKKFLKRPSKLDNLSVRLCIIHCLNGLYLSCSEDPDII